MQRLLLHVIKVVHLLSPRAWHGLQEMSRRLLAEQNAEYEASLAADQQREARRQEEARRAQEAAQQQAAEEARQRCVPGHQLRCACIACALCVAVAIARDWAPGQVHEYVAVKVVAGACYA
jgi:hypothetical protein